MRRYYIFLAWVWSLLWYLALDPLRWAVSWVLNENGMRSRDTWRREQVRSLNRAAPSQLACVLAYQCCACVQAVTQRLP